MQSEKRVPTTEKLAAALREAGAPPSMIKKAESGYYDDYRSPLALPITELVRDCRILRLSSVMYLAMNGGFDAQDWEADEWGKSEEGQATIAAFTSGFSSLPGGVRWRADQTKDK